ncbi:hypothetical protein [Paenibacillus roseipurpureus]|uniref:Uncharacterized protein n=1 Tax=Paenibacillus roseopurpureus TaxID=2918901 RepID=A0AA96LMZ3_9BACL|nr:hypothetical protein [Paenibacillus sp. MBLB1832]WNR42688.1 hypothetical protein MJB10_16360 [Paenibacillus sp. MBLB1832]
MQRHLFYSLLKNGTEEAFRASIRQNEGDLRSQLHSEQVLTVSLFQNGSNVCLYLETELDNFHWDWPDAYADWLEAWPCEQESRLSVPMIDIFHDGVPTDPESWRGNRQVEDRVGCIARLKPDMAASYIYYHYQMQEERPESFNKTYIIGAHGTLLFSYREHPASVSETKRAGKLSSQNTPANWQEVMEPHFDMWTDVPDNEKIWRSMERLL